MVEESGETDAEREEKLREAVERRYDFEEFGPAEMAEISPEEWEAAFDPDTWVTGEELLDRVEQDLRARVERRDVFAVVERDVIEGDHVLVAYSDEGYAVVYRDGTVEGRGTVLRDVKPVVALCSMTEYTPEESVGDGTLPEPGTITDSGTEFGNRVMQVVGVVQLIAGLALVVAWIVYSLSVIVPVVAIGFLGFGVLVLVLVANARLADRFRAEEYRERLRSAGVGSSERPAFVPGGDPTELEDDDGDADGA
ncbi:MAG: hypothetical protein ABEJ57_07400 [Halobacteriaceae archaeon]